MKRIILTCGLLAVLGLSGTGAFAQSHPALGGGNGLINTPYQISTPAHLKALADYVNGGTGSGTGETYI